MSGLVIAGTHSGCGKTTTTLGILAALKKKNYTVQSFKAGPDFIDTGLHRYITGRASRNLDVWMCGRDYVGELFHCYSAGADAAIVEGVMGLYDGTTSTAALAAILGLPVILVVDAYGMAESAGAIVEGFRAQGTEFRVNIAGVIFNRVGSEKHYQRIKNSIQEIPVLGYLPRDLDFRIPHRHLGLVVAEECPIGADEIEKLADSVHEHIDLDLLVQKCGSVKSRRNRQNKEKRGRVRLATPAELPDMRSCALKIGIAYDRAFCFYYDDNLDLLKAAGSEIVTFSPLEDSSVPDGLDALYFGGGYPELYAEALSRNRSMLDSINARSGSGMPIYAECGGFMYLTEGIFDFEGTFHHLAGVFPCKTVMKKGRSHLGYREVTVQRDSMVGSRGTVIRGHEFHYSEIQNRAQGSGLREKGIDLTYSVKDGADNFLQEEGYSIQNVLGSYIHIHFGSNPSIANNFVQSIKEHHGTYSPGRAR